MVSLNMDITITVVNYKTKGLLKQCLKSLLAAAPKLSYEIVVVDNGSGDGSAEMVKERFPAVKLISLAENVGFARGHNLAMKDSAAKYILVLNPDSMMNQGTIETLFDFMEKNLDVGMVGPRLVRPDKTRQESVHHFPTLWTPIFRRTPLGEMAFAKKDLDRYFMRGEIGNEPMDVDWMEGAALFVRRPAIDEVGPFDERYFAYFEDTDWARRFWLRGWRVVYHPGASIIHYHRRESADIPWYLAPFKSSATRIHIMSAIKYFQKWRGEREPR